MCHWSRCVQCERLTETSSEEKEKKECLTIYSISISIIACELPPHHHVYQRTLLPFGDPGRLSSSAHICLACSENATRNIAPLSTPMAMHNTTDLQLNGNDDEHEDEDTDLLLKKDLTATALLRRRYTLEDKYDVVTKVKDDGTNKKEVAEQFGINKATLNAWLRQKKSIIKQCKGVQERQRFSYLQKHEILSKIKQDKSNKKEIMEAFGIKKHTLNTWLRNRTDIARTSEDLPARKANYHSAIWRIHDGVDAFFAENQLRHGKDRINITGYVLGVHANKVKDELLERHTNKEIVLDEQELKHLMKFKGSDSWGRKYAKAKGWRGPEYRKDARAIEDGNHTNDRILIHHRHHHHHDDASDALEQHAAHHQHHQQQHDSNNNMMINNRDAANMDTSNSKSDESFGYHMYAHNIQQMTPNHLTMPQTNNNNTIDPLANNMQHPHMHHPQQQQQLHSSNDNTMAPPNMLSQHQQQQQVMQQQMQQQPHHHHHQTMQQQQTMQHHMQHVGEQQHTLDHTIVGHDPTMGMPQQQSLPPVHLHTDLPPNVPDPRSYNSFV